MPALFSMRTQPTSRRRRVHLDSSRLSFLSVRGPLPFLNFVQTLPRRALGSFLLFSFCSLSLSSLSVHLFSPLYTVHERASAQPATMSRPRQTNMCCIFASLERNCRIARTEPLHRSSFVRYDVFVSTVRTRIKAFACSLRKNFPNFRKVERKKKKFAHPANAQPGGYPSRPEGDPKVCDQGEEKKGKRRKVNWRKARKTNTTADSDALLLARTNHIAVDGSLCLCLRLRPCVCVCVFARPFPSVELLRSSFSLLGC